MTTTAQDLAARIRAFSVDCAAGEYTNTGDAWDLLNEAAALLEPDPVSAALADLSDEERERIADTTLASAIRRLEAMRDALRDLVGWQEYMGGFEAPAWDRARRLLDEPEDDDERAVERYSDHGN